MRDLTDAECNYWTKQHTDNPNATQYYNPITNRLISKTGITYKQIQNACKPHKYSKEDCLKWQKNDTKNPITGYNIKKDKPTYKELEKHCQKYLQPQKTIVKSLKSPKDIRAIESHDSKKYSLQQQSQQPTYSHYPSISDPSFRKKLNKLLEFSIHEEPELEQIRDIAHFENVVTSSCPKNDFNKAYFQYFVSHYLSNRTPYTGLLMYYSVGTGKTCAAVSIAESILVDKKVNTEPSVYVLLPPTLKNNFQKTIYTAIDSDKSCTGNIYPLLTKFSNNQLATNRIISQRYKIMSYGEFVKFVKSQNNRIFEHKTFIVDEAHNLRNPEDLDPNNNDEALEYTSDLYYNSLFDVLQKGKNNKLILMTGTPMYNQPNEILDLFNLLLVNDNKPIIKFKDSDPINMELIAKLSKQYVSYINSNNPFVYGQTIRPTDASNFDVNKYGMIITELGKHQKKSYIDNYANKNILMGAFGPANITYPSKQFFSVFRRKSPLMTYEYINPDKPILYPDENNLGQYGAKILKVCQSIEKSTGIVIVYSRLISDGILPTAIALEHMGYSRYIDGKNDVNLLHYPGLKRKPKHRYAILTSNSLSHIDNIGSFTNIINTVNSSSNINGEQIKVLLITKKASEGLSFLNVRELHILDPWYHYNRIEQIKGRGIRRCSHISLPLEKRNMTIYLHCATIKNGPVTVDEHAYKIADSKLKISQQITQTMAENAIDCGINRNLNIYSQKIFEHINPIKMITSQGNEVEIMFGTTDECKCDKPNPTNKYNIWDDTNTIYTKYIKIIKNTMKTNEMIELDKLRTMLNLNDSQQDLYFYYVIIMSTFPNKIMNKYMLHVTDTHLYRINDNVKTPLIATEIKLTNDIDTTIDSNKDEQTDIETDTLTSLQHFEEKYSDFPLIYHTYSFIKLSTWDNIAQTVLKHSTKLPKISAMFTKLCAIFPNYKLYADLFADEVILKDLEGEETTNKNIKLKDFVLKNNKFYGSISPSTTKKDILKFKIHNDSNEIKKGTRNGAICETMMTDAIKQQSKLNNINASKKELCVAFAQQFYDDNNLRITPYKQPA